MNFMNLAATFFISVYGLAALGGGILAWAEQTPSVTVASVPLAVIALLLNERFRLVRLDGLWIGLAGFASFIYPAYEFLSGNEESRLLSVAHLLVLLQWVLMFTNKSAHQYWWICAVSCLQIAVAAVLTNSPLFGLLILIYMFMAMWTLSVFTLLLARLRYGRVEDYESPGADWKWPRLHVGKVRTEKVAVAEPVSAASEFRGSFQGQGQETDLNWRFVGGIFGLSSMAMLLGLVFFLLTPRLWIGVSPFQDSALAGNNPQTGSSDKVQLGDFGRILESSAPVLEMQVYDEQTSQSVHLQEYLAQIGQTEPLLRGRVLAVYQGGAWSPYRTGAPARPFNKQLSVFQDRRRRYFRQTIRLEPIGSRSIFSLVAPEYGRVEDQAGDLRILDDTQTLLFNPSTALVRGAIRYHLVSGERVDPLGPQLYHVSRDDSQISPVYLIRAKNTQYVDELARQLVERTRARTAPREPTSGQIADTIVTHLRDSGEFTYSLDQSVIVPNIDPVVDFLKFRKAGHCQYFATALALLLRSADIPSRVVTGYKGGMESSGGQILEVQQRHAHAWVEGHLDGQWVTLDATPVDAREESVEAMGGSVRWYHRLINEASNIWNDYFVNLSYSKQQRDLYEPLRGFAGIVTDRLAGTSNFWAELQANLQEIWMRPQSLLSFRGLLLIALFLLTLLGMFYLVRATWRLTLRLWHGSIGEQRRRVHIEFYERFLALLKPLGLVPEPSQTQLEFARHVETEWPKHGLPPEVAPLAQEISLAFYRLRFGTDPLSAEQEDQIESRLRQLELAVRK